MTVADDEIQIPLEILEPKLASALRRAGLSEPIARIIAETVAGAEIDGSRSHGIHRLPGYVSSISSGWINTAAKPAFEQTRPGCLAVEADNGFAQQATRAFSNRLAGMARSQGVATMFVRNSHHFGALWQDVEPLARAGLISIAMVNSRSHMAVWQGKRKTLGTNPIAFACPRTNAPPLVWDQASSIMSHGDILLHAAAGRPVPSGVGINRDGDVTTDPAAILDGGALLPFGGAKGASLAFMAEVLVAALSGGTFGFEDCSSNFPGAKTSNAGQFILALDPGAGGNASFQGQLERLIAELKHAGSTRMPADNRYRRRQAVHESGMLSVDARNWARVLSLAED
ncbi:Ldh family oxidoreductase [Bradyrhizobium guangxiense]|uniref:Ldh family oxidoreductase n=1 Tax=Bradyrhizobium guangxiense TaxID=1325115 RepID=UPI0013E8D55A|nr:Ldh family oxidoreductase [Bradyrhizobium guangxiense]